MEPEGQHANETANMQMRWKQTVGEIPLERTENSGEMKTGSAPCSCHSHQPVAHCRGSFVVGELFDGRTVRSPLLPLIIAFVMLLARVLSFPALLTDWMVQLAADFAFFLFRSGVDGARDAGNDVGHFCLPFFGRQGPGTGGCYSSHDRRHGTRRIGDR